MLASLWGSLQSKDSGFSKALGLCKFKKEKLDVESARALGHSSRGGPSLDAPGPGARRGWEGRPWGAPTGGGKMGLWPPHGTRATERSPSHPYPTWPLSQVQGPGRPSAGLALGAGLFLWLSGPPRPEASPAALVTRGRLHLSRCHYRPPVPWSHRPHFRRQWRHTASGCLAGPCPRG